MVQRIDSSTETTTNSSLSRFAKDVSFAADTITAYCSKQRLPQPSFDPSAPSITIPSTAPLAVRDARQKLIASASAIQQLASEPAEYVPNFAIHYQVLSCLRWLAEFDIFTKIPRHESVSYNKLATAAGVPETELRSASRMVITSNLLCEPQPNHVGHNAVSALFISDPRLIYRAKYMTQYSMPTAAAFADATKKWGATDRKDETAFNIAMNTDGSFFDYYAKSPELAECFAAYMESVQSSYGTSTDHLVSGFDWANLERGLVVDVGGSTCKCSIALASSFPNLSFVVEDLPETIANAESVLADQPLSIKGRISTRAHNFFDPQPVTDASVYLLRMILHDWPHAKAVAILKNLVPALKVNPAARIVVMDTVLPLPGSMSHVEEALLRVRDLTMIQAFHAKEREMSEFVELFTEAKDEDGCLVLVNAVKPPGSVMSVLEVAYQRFEIMNGTNDHV